MHIQFHVHISIKIFIHEETWWRKIRSFSPKQQNEPLNRLQLYEILQNPRNFIWSKFIVLRKVLTAPVDIRAYLHQFKSITYEIYGVLPRAFV